MAVLRVLSAQGDTQIEWEREQAETGDPEAMAAVHEAEQIFAEQRARGATAFRIAAERRAERLDAFDPNAEQIVFVPRVAGG
jgi:hypothetical protein